MFLSCPSQFPEINHDISFCKSAGNPLPDRHHPLIRLDRMHPLLPRASACSDQSKCVDFSRGALASDSRMVLALRPAHDTKIVSPNLAALFNLPHVHCNKQRAQSSTVAIVDAERVVLHKAHQIFDGALGNSTRASCQQHPDSYSALCCNAHISA